MNSFSKLLKTKEFQIIAFVFFIYWFVNWSARKLRENKGRYGNVNRQNLDPLKNYNAIALKLKLAMTGLGGAGDEIATLIPLNDDELKEVYNKFADMVDKSGTLRTWIDDEYLPFTEADETILKRFDDLGLA